MSHARSTDRGPIPSYTAEEKSAAWRWLKEFALREDAPHHAAVALLEWTALKEANKRLAGPLGTRNAAPQRSTAELTAAPLQEGVGQRAAADAALSVGPWKECVYKHTDAPKPVEVRLNDDKTLDEVVAKNAQFHLEQMDFNHWWMDVEVDGKSVSVWLHSKTTIRATYEHRDYSRLPATPSGVKK